MEEFRYERGSAGLDGPENHGEIVSASPRNDRGRDYTRKSYQALMAVVEALDEAAPLPVTQKQLQAKTGLSKNVVFDVVWNLCKRGWAEEAGDGAVRLRRGREDRLARVGRMMLRLVRDVYGVDLEEVTDGRA